MVGIQVLSETMYSVFSTQHTQLFHVIHVCDAGNNDKRRSAEYYPTSIAGFFVACQCKDRYRSRALICDSGRDGRILLAHVVMATICHSFSRLSADIPCIADTPVIARMWRAPVLGVALLQ